MRTFGLVLTLFAFLLTSCGSESNNDSEQNGTNVNVVFDESQVVGYLDLSEVGNSWVFTADDGQTCDIAVVLTSASEVELYADAGDNVAQNSAGTAGVKITDAEGKTCHALLTEAISGLK